MTTQLNLLPDVKLEYIKAQRARRLVVSVSVLVTIAAVVLVFLLLSVDGLQKKHLGDLSDDIQSETSTLQHEPQINKILTVQNQLSSLTSLHAAKPAAPKLFDYLNQVTPSNVNITDFTTDFTQHTATITGTSGSLTSVNQYIDTLKYTNFTVSGSKDAKPAFSNVVLSSFSLNTGSQSPGQAANYTINLGYDPTIFDITKNVKLSVPSTATTRLQQPTNDLFQAAPAGAKGGQ
jgi:Tfp pilus assembly protein PilN